MDKKRILFLCTGNAARSQMAEGLARANHDDKIEVVSAGSRPAGFVHPNAVRALSEIGIDIHDAQSKSADEFLVEPFDVVVTVCDSAAAVCRCCSFTATAGTLLSGARNSITCVSRGARWHSICAGWACPIFLATATTQSMRWSTMLKR